MKHLIGLSILSLSLAGCFPAAHDHMIYTPNKAKVENQTGQSVRLSVCSKYTTFSTEKYGAVEIEIPGDLRSEFSLIQSSEHKITYDSNGGFDYAYSGNVNYIHFALDQASFDLVKLCFSTEANIIVTKTNPCPSQSVEQSTAGVCNN